MTDFEKSIKRNVIDKDKFMEIRDHKYGKGDIYDTYTYGMVASWLVWNRDDQGKITIEGPHPGNSKHFDDYILDWDEDAKLPEDQRFSKKLTTDIVFVGLNMSGDGKPVGDIRLFENARCHIRIIKTFFGTEAEGGYFTDIIKPDKRLLDKVGKPANASEVMQIVRNRSDILKEHIQVFKNELAFIGAKKPLIIVFGGDARWIVEQGFQYRILDKSQFHGVVYTMHYSGYPKDGDFGYTKKVSGDLARYITIPNDEKELNERWKRFGILNWRERIGKKRRIIDMDIDISDL
jgi:hypothetical protein